MTFLYYASWTEIPWGVFFVSGEKWLKLTRWNTPQVFHEWIVSPNNAFRKLPSSVIFISKLPGMVPFSGWTILTFGEGGNRINPLILHERPPPQRNPRAIPSRHLDTPPWHVLGRHSGPATGDGLGVRCCWELSYRRRRSRRRPKLMNRC